MSAGLPGRLREAAANLRGERLAVRTLLAAHGDTAAGGLLLRVP